MAIARTNLPDLYTPIYDEALLSTFEMEETVYDKVFDVRSDDSKEVKTTSISGLGNWETVQEGQPIPQEDVVQMYDKTFTHNKIGKGFKVTFEAARDDEYALLSKVDNAKQMGQGAIVNVETACGNIFNNAFASGAGADGVYLCSNTHPKNPDESTTYYDNYITNALSHDGIEAMEQQIYANLKGPKGIVIPIPKKGILLVPPQLKGTAMRICAEAAGLRPETAENDINIYAGKYEVVVWRYLTNAAYWFIVFPSLKGLRFYWRRKPHYESYIDYGSESYVWNGKMRYSCGWTGDGWRSVWGSDGSA